MITIVITTTTARTPLPPPTTIQPSRMQFFSKVHLHPAVHGCPWLSMAVLLAAPYVIPAFAHPYPRHALQSVRFSAPPPPLPPEGRPVMCDVSLLSGISGLSFDSHFLSVLFLSLFFSFLPSSLALSVWSFFC